MAALLLGRADDTHMRLAAIDDALPDPAMAEAHAAFIAQTQANPMVMDPVGSVAAEANCTPRVVQIADLKATDRYARGVHSTQYIVEVMGQRSTLCVPLLCPDGAIGAINLHRRTVSPFSEIEVALVENFAAPAVIAIETVRRFRTLETLNAALEERVQAQVDALERMGRLKRFLPAAVADQVVGDEGRL